MFDKVRANIKGEDLRGLMSKLSGLRETSNLLNGDVKYTGNYENVFVIMKNFKDNHGFYLDFSPHVFLKRSNLNNISIDDSLTSIEMLAEELEIDNLNEFEVTSLHIGFNYKIGYPVSQFIDNIERHQQLENYNRFNNGIYFENSSQQICIYNKGIEAGTEDIDLIRCECRIKHPKTLLQLDSLCIEDLYKPDIQKQLLHLFKQAIQGLVINHKPRTIKIDSSAKLDWKYTREMILSNLANDTNKLNELITLISGLPKSSFTTKDQQRNILNHLKKLSNNIQVPQNKKHNTINELIDYLNKMIHIEKLRV